VGGNVARAEKLNLTSTVLGTAERPLARDGARPGDECWLVGDVGLAAAGLALLLGKKRAESAAARRCLAAFRRPRALIERGLMLSTRAHAAIDISDGLAGDAMRVADASRCRLLFEERAVRRALAPELVAVARGLGRDPLELALYGGEDYALVCAGTAERRPRWARSIGRFERGSGGYLEREDGRRVPLRGGFDHFRP
jgi:thiamine-monophosphate kinase